MVNAILSKYFLCLVALIVVAVMLFNPAIAILSGIIDFLSDLIFGDPLKNCYDAASRTFRIDTENLNYGSTNYEKAEKERRKAMRACDKQYL